MRLKPLTPGDLTPEQQELYDDINGGPRGPVHITADGSLQGPFNAMLHHPTIGVPLHRVGAALRYHGVLSPRARELAILTVAAAHRAEFEWYAHAPIAAGLGVPPDAIETIRQGNRPLLDDDLEQTVVDVARTILDHRDLDDGAFEHAARVIGEPGLVELTTLVGYYGILAVQMGLFRVPLPPGASPSFG